MLGMSACETKLIRVERLEIVQFLYVRHDAEIKSCKRRFARNIVVMLVACHGCEEGFHSVQCIYENTSIVSQGATAEDENPERQTQIKEWPRRGSQSPPNEKQILRPLV
jgi:hypothetical protein